ncbi:ABC transporter ATP-binding protein [Jatrophihabitans sp. YIM 134969]
MPARVAVPWAAVTPVLVVLGLALVFCLVDLARRPVTRNLPRWIWVVLCFAFLPWGMVGYLVFGRGERRSVPTEPSAPTAAEPLLPPPLATSAAPGAPAVRTHALVCEFAGGVGVHGVDLEVPARGVYGLVGPNGAGKSTLLAMVTGLRRADSGRVELGVPRERISVCPDVAEFEPWLTATETVALSRQLVCGDGDAPRAARIVREVLHRTGLDAAAGRRVGTFSRGMTQRLGIAAAMVVEPAVLVVDEPTSALDPTGRAEVLTLLAEIGTSAAVVFSSHILADVERIAPRVGVLVDGRLLYQGRTDELVARHVRPVWRVRVHGDVDVLADRLRRAAWVTSVETIGPGHLLVATTDTDSGGRQLARSVADSGLAVVEIAAVDADLETAFRALTSAPPAPPVALSNGPAGSTREIA